MPFLSRQDWKLTTQTITTNNLPTAEHSNHHHHHHHHPSLLHTCHNVIRPEVSPNLRVIALRVLLCAGVALKLRTHVAADLPSVYVK